MKKIHSQIAISEMANEGPLPELSNDKKLKEVALAEMKKSPPLMYLSLVESKMIIEESRIETYPKEAWIMQQGHKNDKFGAFFIIKGEALVFRETDYLELIPKGTFFGFDGPLFSKRFYSVRAGENCVILNIPSGVLLKYLRKDSKVTLNVARNLLVKHNILGSLISFKSYLRQLKSGSKFDKGTLLNYYRKMDSCLHPFALSPTLDTNAWLYAIRRLPQNVTSTLVFFITTKNPEVLSHPEVSSPVKTASRPRQIFQTMPGKSVAVLRDLETDLFDLMSNLCIHMVESEKIIKKLRSPMLFKDLICFRNDQSEVVKLLESTDLSKDEINGLSKIWPKNLGEHLFNILMHYNNFSIDVMQPTSHLKLDATEKWVTRLWFAVASLLKLGPDASCDSIPDEEMTIDIVQGSRRAFTSLISPFIHSRREVIAAWAADAKPKLITKKFGCPSDLLYANAHYYQLNHTELSDQKIKEEEENGIVRIDETEMTGVAISLVDVSKLKKDLVDPMFTPKPANKYHVLINIGYTFGVQSSDIIRAIMNIFGKKIRSINIIGKAGGMEGSVGDILLATRIHNDEAFEVVNNNLGNLNLEQLEKEAGRPVHAGPMLTVAGTVIQNPVLLNYYKKLYHCVGLEMEALHFAREIKRYQELGLVRPDITSRFAYYTSDLPLDPNSNLR